MERYLHHGLSHDAYLQHLRADAGRLAAVAAQGLDAPVPSCPGWHVRDVVEHTAEVYLHKVACIRDRAAPEPWPPPRDATPPLRHLEVALDALLHELTSHSPGDFAETWWWDEQTVGFWARRMAHETAVHRLDVELAHDAVTPVDWQLAEDGVDEVLRRFLAGDWSDGPVAAAAGSVLRIRTGDRVWRVVLEPAAVVASVERHPRPPADVTVTADAQVLYRWAWGRGPADHLLIEGEGGLVDALRERLALATQ